MSFLSHCVLKEESTASLQEIFARMLFWTVRENSEIVFVFILSFPHDLLSFSLSDLKKKVADIFGSSDIFIRSHELVAQQYISEFYWHQL